MLRVLMIPLIVLILLKNLEALRLLADGVDAGFRRDLQTVRCAREEVYRRNVNDAYRFLASLYTYVKDQTFDAGGFLEASEGECLNHEALVYREVNAELPLPTVYPNWLYREGVHREAEGE